MTTLKDKLNAANPNELADMLKAIGLGDIARALPTKLYAAAVVASPADMIANVQTTQLPNDAKAVKVVRAYARAGSGTLGELTVDAPPMSSATAAGHVNVSESGDITYASADAWTSVDVEYATEKLNVQIVNLLVSATADTFVVPTNFGTAVRLMSVTVTAGTTTGVYAVVAPSDSKPGSTKQVNFKLAKDKILTKATDAATAMTAVIGYAPAASKDLNALLEGDPSPFI
jgi:hypothetical protein